MQQRIEADCECSTAKSAASGQLIYKGELKGFIRNTKYRIYCKMHYCNL